MSHANLKGANLEDANWWEADLRNWVYDIERKEHVPTNEDKNLKNWLQENFPRPLL